MRVRPQRGSEFTAQELLSRIRRRATLLVLLMVALASSTQLAAQSAASVTLVKAERLLDPRSGHVLTSAAVLIAGDKIKQVGTPAQIGAPAGAKIIDLGKATL